MNPIGTVDGVVVDAATELAISGATVSILAGGMTLTAMSDMNGHYTVAKVPAGSFVNVSGVTMQHGAATRGGAIVNNGTLTVTRSTFQDDNAAELGGAISNGDQGNIGTLTVTGSTFDDDSAVDAGGAISSGLESGVGDGILDISDSTFVGNSTGDVGGAIDSADTGIGSARVASSTFQDNSASVSGGVCPCRAQIAVRINLAAHPTLFYSWRGVLEKSRFGRNSMGQSFRTCPLGRSTLLS